MDNFIKTILCAVLVTIWCVLCLILLQNLGIVVTAWYITISCVAFLGFLFVSKLRK